MKKDRSKYRIALYAAIAVALVAAGSVLRGDVLESGASSFWAPSGVWSLLPPIVAILLAFTTKNVVVSLLFGVLSGAYLLALQGGSANVGTAAIESFSIATQRMLNSAADPWNAGILLQCGAIGGLVALLARGGGVQAVAKKLARLARGPASSQIVTWILGLFVFFDDYANVQIVGPIMRPITERNRISRERLAFILDSTAAPVAGIALISTWIGTEISYIREGLATAGIENVAPYELFVQTIPYRFYNLLALFFVAVGALALREYGPMRKAELLARQGLTNDDSKTDSPAAELEAAPNQAVETESNPRRRRFELPPTSFATIPILVLIAAAFAYFYTSGRDAILTAPGLQTGDAAAVAAYEALQRPFSFNGLQAAFGEADASVAIFRAAFLAGLVALAMIVFTGKASAQESVSVWLNGVKSLAFTFVILILAWSLSSCIGKDGLGTARFLVGALSNDVPAFLLPTLIFVMASIVSFATGTSYGTMAILTPLAIPFANELAPGDFGFLIASTSAVLSGAIFGDHCSPISDTTILAATNARCGLLEHVSTQLPYALTVAAISIACFLTAGLGVSVWFVWPFALAAVVAVIMIFGKKTPSSGREDGANASASDAATTDEPKNLAS